jgi:hypothetical protein
VSGADGIRWRARQTVAAMSMATRRALPWPDDIRRALVLVSDASTLPLATDGADMKIAAAD